MISDVKNKAESSRFRLRPRLVSWHKWFGLLSAIWLILLSITGCILVFYQELDLWLNPQIHTVQALEHPQQLDLLVNIAEQTLPGTYTRLIDLPEHKQQSLRVLLQPRRDSNNAPSHGRSVYLNPYDGTVLGGREFGALKFDRLHIMPLIYQLHMDLLLGPWMVWWLGLIALLWTIDHFIALCVSFPRISKWLQSFRVRGKTLSYPWHFSLHRAMGLIFIPVTFVLAISGVYLNWHHEFSSVVSVFSKVTPFYPALHPKPQVPQYQRITSLEQVKKQAKVHNNLQADMILFNPRANLYEVRQFDPLDIDPYGRRKLAIDNNNGQIVNEFHAPTAHTGDKIMVWQYPLHSGKAFGWPGRIIIFISGLVVLWLTIGGFYLWRRKKVKAQ